MQLPGYLCKSHNGKAIYCKIYNIKDLKIKNIATYRAGSEFKINKFEYEYNKRLVTGAIQNPVLPTWGDTEDNIWATTDEGQWEKDIIETKTKRKRRRQKLANSRSSYIQTKSQNRFKNKQKSINLYQTKRNK